MSIAESQHEAVLAKAVAALRQSDFSGARRFAAMAIAISPATAEAIECLGVAVRDTGLPSLASRLAKRARAADPVRAGAEASHALRRHREGSWEAAQRLYRRALALDPVHREATNNLASLALDLGQAGAADNRLKRVVALAPQWFAGQANLGNSHCLSGRLRSARVAYGRALAFEPASPAVWANLARVEQGLLEPNRAELCLLRALGAAEEPRVRSNLVFARSYRADVDARRLFATVRRWAELHGRARPAPAPRNADPERPLRVGYLSADLRNHPVGWNLIGLLENHDPARVEAFAYSTLRQEDALTRRFATACAGRWRSVGAGADAAVAEAIAADRIDLLVIAAGHTEGNRLGVAALRPSPIQISIHDLTSSGLDAIDYWLTDELLHPSRSAELFTETLVRLPCFYLHMRPPNLEAPEPDGEGPAPVRFGSVNNPIKFTDGLLRLWAEILNAVPQSRLVLRYFDAFAHADGRAPVADRLARHGVDRERISFSAGSRDRLQQLLHLGSIDIALDPFPFNGATSTFEALWMGVPVVALAGERFLGRVALSHLHRVGLGDLVAADTAAYVRIAVALAKDRKRRLALRRTLRERLGASALCDAPAYARSLEAAYRRMWRARCAGRRWDGWVVPEPGEPARPGTP
ncbi:MAG: hypothetical protein HYR63_24630 [Proteobacteria bacterium]|nr:hypothetical protein [Pseudomonadota bacterium]